MNVRYTVAAGLACLTLAGCPEYDPSGPGQLGDDAYRNPDRDTRYSRTSDTSRPSSIGRPDAEPVSRVRALESENAQLKRDLYEAQRTIDRLRQGG